MTISEFFIEKTISLLIVGIILFTLSLQSIVILFIVLGQAHFLIAYLYQYRAGKMKKSMKVWYPIVLLPLLVLGFFGQLIALALLATIFFAIHFAQDEIFLAGKETSLFTSLEVLAFVLVLVGVVVDLILMTSFVMYFFALAALTLVVYAYFIFSKKYIFTRVSIYLLSITFFLSLVTLLGYHIPLEKIIGGVILLHFSTWYINYFFKTKEIPSYRKQYLTRVVIVNVIAIGSYFIFIQTGLGIFNYFFALIYFYVWTMMHILSSVRLADYKNGVRII